MEYLGHIISGDGVSTDPSKVESMVAWPTPTTVKHLRGFIGLTGYYRWFIKDYGLICRPLTQLLRKGAFNWTTEAQLAFDKLKQAMTTAPVLALPDYTQPFIVETDASGLGIGAVLMQQGRPLAFLSKSLTPRQQALSTYEKELLAIVMATQKWQYYLQGHHFVIKTDHQSLKYLLEQRLSTIFQQKWLAKLMGLDYEICYKKGKENIVADALSRVPEQKPAGGCSMITYVQQSWLHTLSDSYQGDPTAQAIIDGIVRKDNKFMQYQYVKGLLKMSDKLYVGSIGDIRSKYKEQNHLGMSRQPIWRTLRTRGHSQENFPVLCMAWLTQGGQRICCLL